MTCPKVIRRCGPDLWCGDSKEASRRRFQLHRLELLSKVQHPWSPLCIASIFTETAIDHGETSVQLELASNGMEEDDVCLFEISVWAVVCHSCCTPKFNSADTTWSTTLCSFLSNATP